MFRSPLAYIAVLFCIIFSCTSNIELPPLPPADDQSSSSNEDSSSSELGSSDESSSSQTITQSSDTSGGDREISSSSQTLTPSSTGGNTLVSSSSLEQINNSEPKLVGECVWSENPATMARGAMPSGISIVDTDNVCGNKKSIVYKYDEGFETWPANGIVKTGIYDDVEATLNCPAYNKPVAVPCPTLIVDEHSDYQIVCSGAQIEGRNCGMTTTSPEIKVQNDKCIDVEFNWTNSGFHPDMKMQCEGQFESLNGKAPNSSISIKVGKNNPIIESGGWHIINEITIIPKIQVGLTKVLGICISYTSDQKPPSSLTCKLAAF